MLGIVLAGGNGTRFSESGCCKPLLKINGKYLIEYSLDNLAAMQIDRVVIVVGKYGEAIKAALGESYLNMSLNYAQQEIPAGCIHALYAALPYWNGEAVILQLSDEVFIGFDSGVIKQKDDADFICGFTATSNWEAVKENYAVYCKERSAQIIYCEEKPKTVHNNKKGTGFCIFNSSCISFLKEQYPSACDHFVTLSDYMNGLIKEGKTGIAVPVAKEEININTSVKMQYAQRMLQTVAENE